MKLNYMCAESLESVDIDELYLQGKRFMILDIDNTITEWKSPDVSDSVKEWIKNARERGFTLFLLSNNHNKTRSRDMANMLGAKWCDIKYKKPSLKAFANVTEYLNADKKECVMIGDQMYGDMLGAKRADIDGILLDPIAKKEAPVTKILRVWERLMGRKIVYRKDK